MKHDIVFALETIAIWLTWGALLVFVFDHTIWQLFTSIASQLP